MPAKHVRFGQDARDRILRGVNVLADTVTVIAELPKGAMSADQAAAVAAGIRLRAYKFDRYKTKKKDGEEAALRADVSVAVDDPPAARKAFAPNANVVDGVITARDLVNEPPNILFPAEFARRSFILRPRPGSRARKHTNSPSRTAARYRHKNGNSSGFFIPVASRPSGIASKTKRDRRTNHLWHTK